MRQKRSEALREADVVLLAGTVCDFRLNYGRSPRSKIIAVNRNKCVCGQKKIRFSIFRKDSLPVFVFF